MSRPVTPKAAKLMQEGMQLMQAGAFLEAGRAFERAAQQMPDLADAHCFRADALMRAGKLESALSAAERAVRLRPDWGEAWMLRGNLEALLKRFTEAEEAFRRAMQLMGSNPGLHANLANILASQDRLDDALAEYELALRRADDIDIRCKRALILERLGRRLEAESAWNEVLERDPDSLVVMEQLLQIYRGSRRVLDMERICARALGRTPDAAIFRLGQGEALWWRERHEEALEVFQDAARMASGSNKEVMYEAIGNEATGLLKLGRLREGWAKYSQRADRDALRERYGRLAADPAELAGDVEPRRIRVHMEQGLGDELFFLRFAPALRSRGHTLLVGTHRKLQPLLARRRDLFEWVGLEDAPDAPNGDIELLSSDLPLASGQDLAAPLSLPVNEGRKERLAGELTRFGPPPYVGVTWRAGLLPREQKGWRGRFWSKWLPPDELGRSLRALSATVVVVQREPDSDERAAFRRGLGRESLDLSSVNDDVDDALALLSLLHEYVGVSNTNMHLRAGLPGKVARVLVLMPCEWRWGLREATSPWFPGFHLYRQAESGSWDEALNQLSDDLAASQGSSPSRAPLGTG